MARTRRPRPKAPALGQLRDVNERLVFAALRAEDAMAKAESARKTAVGERRALEREARRRERLLGIMGHDLRDPVAAILMAAQLLARLGGLDGTHAEMLGGIEQSARRIRELVDEIVDAARDRLAGELELHPESIELGEVAREVLREVELAHGVSGRFKLELDGPVVGRWDRSRIAQLIGNLARNAIQHGAPGRPITVRAHALGGDAVLEVHNQGKPLPAALRRQPFRPLRGRAALPSLRSGGLGLQIAFEVVRAHGGAMAVRSSAARGTTFRITLPRGRVRRSRPSRPSRSAPRT